MSDATQAQNTALTVHEGNAGRPSVQKEPFTAGARPLAIVPQTFEQAYRVATVVHRSGMAPSSLDSLEKVMVAILHGLEVGLTPMAALQTIAVINGRPTIWGDGAVGLIRASGLLEYMKEYYEHEDTPDMKAVCIVKRRGETEPVKTTFSLIDARKADLLSKKGPWQTYPKRMLKMRARWALRDTFADVLKGLHLREEVEDHARSQHAEREPELPFRAPVDDLLADLPPDPTETVTQQVTNEVVDPATGEVTIATHEDGAPITEKEVATAKAAVAEHRETLNKIVPETMKADPISSGTISAAPGQTFIGTPTDFPGDKPMKQEAAPDNGDLPWQLDRKLSENDREWLRELDEEFGQCADLESIASVAESIMDPVQGAVAVYVWGKACELMDRHIERVNG